MKKFLSVDFEDDADIDAFLEYVRYHSKRLRCPEKDVFIKLAEEWKKQQAFTKNLSEMDNKKKSKDE